LQSIAWTASTTSRDAEVDEESQVRVLDRPQPLLPMRPGQIERRTHDYDRHGTTTLFAGPHRRRDGRDEC
jgi:hypothetical protein